MAYVLVKQVCIGARTKGRKVRWLRRGTAITQLYVLSQNVIAKNRIETGLN